MGIRGHKEVRQTTFLPVDFHVLVSFVLSFVASADLYLDHTNHLTSRMVKRPGWGTLPTDGQFDLVDQKLINSLGKQVHCGT